MTSPTFDSSGYPTDETLDAIEKWPHSDPDGWFTFIRAAWNHHYGTIIFPFLENGFVSFTTGGWSGNESIISAMRENVVLWTMLWESSHRGGKYVFRLAETNK